MALNDIAFSNGKLALEIPLGASPGPIFVPSAPLGSTTMFGAIQELWRIHGLDTSNQMVVNNDANTRVAGAISQTVATVSNVTTVTRI